MKKTLLLLLPLILSVNSISFAQEKSPNQTQEAVHPESPSSNEHVTPVFPFEDLIRKPNEETDRFFTEFLNMAATLGLLISLIFILAWFAKRMLNTKQLQVNATSLIKVTERRALSAKTVVYLLDIEGTSIVIAESHNGVTLLSDYKTPEEESSSPPPFKL